MGYRPNPLVAAHMFHLRTTRAPKFEATLAFLNAFTVPVHDHISVAFEELFQGARTRAEELGFQMEEFWLREPGMTSRRLSKILDARGINGLVIPPIPPGKGHLSLDWERLSAVSIGYSMWRPKLHRVSHYHAHGLILAVKNLERLGYRRIGLALSTNFNERVDHGWIASLLDYQSYLPLEQRVPPLLELGDMPGLADWYGQYKPDVVLGHHEIVLKKLREIAQVPQEVGFVHLDRTATLMSCAGVDQQVGKIGATAVELVVSELQQNMRGVPSSPKLVFLEGEWVPGGTVCKQKRA